MRIMNREISRNTVERIISASILMILVVVALIAGPKSIAAFLLLMGILINDELVINFLRRSRFSLDYLLLQFLFVVPLS